jgi:redox-sensing transcriptional repressor
MSARSGKIPNATIRRLTSYLRQLETLAAEGNETITSVGLALLLGLKAPVVRSDMLYIRVRAGRRGLGYPIRDLISRIRDVLGTDRTQDVILVGVGNLGRAIANYPGLLDRKFRMLAVFDHDPHKIGRRIGQLTILGLEELPHVVARSQAKLAILTVPHAEAQEVADLVCASGIRGILSFCPVRAPAGSTIVVDIASELEQLSYDAGLGSLAENSDH